MHPAAPDLVVFSPAERGAASAATRRQAAWTLPVLVLQALALLGLIRWTAALVVEHADWAPWRLVLAITSAWAVLLALSEAALVLARLLVLRPRTGAPLRARAVARGLLAPAALHAVAAVVAAIVGWHLVRLGDLGWVVAAPVMAGIEVAIVGGPVRRARVRYDLRPLDDVRARTLLWHLVRATPAEGVELFVMRTSVATPDVDALAATVGRRSIVLSDSALALPDDELRAVLAHQLGHLALGHARVRPWGLLLSATVGSVLALALAPALHRSVGPVARATGVPERAVPIVWGTVVVLSAGFRLLAAVLLRVRVGRAEEVAADRFGLELTHDPGAFSRMVHDVARASLARPDGAGGGLSCTFPSPEARLAVAVAWDQAHPRVPPPWPAPVGPPDPAG